MHIHLPGIQDSQGEPLLPCPAVLQKDQKRAGYDLSSGSMDTTRGRMGIAPALPSHEGNRQ